MSARGYFLTVCKRGHDFNKTRYFKDGKSKGCYECAKITTSEGYHKDPSIQRKRSVRWAKEHPEYRNKNNYRFHLKKTYGFSLEEHETMLTKQHGRCAICGDEPPNNKKLHVDHNHTTGKVRALICQNCNHAVGHVKEDPMRAYRVATYLQKHV